MKDGLGEDGREEGMKRGWSVGGEEGNRKEVVQKGVEPSEENTWRNDSKEGRREIDGGRDMSKYYEKKEGARAGRSEGRRTYLPKPLVGSMKIRH